MKTALTTKLIWLWMNQQREMSRWNRQCNSNKRFTALNFIISVQYKTNIYTVLYCADYISYPWCCTVLHWRKFRIQKLFCFVLNLYEWTATALNCTDMFEYKSALYCFVLGAVNPVPRRSRNNCNIFQAHTGQWPTLFLFFTEEKLVSIVT